MKCSICGTEIHGRIICPHCGAFISSAPWAIAALATTMAIAFLILWLRVR